MNYITTAEAAKKWGLTARRVLELAKRGRISGTVQIGTRWMIPDDAIKPTDGRTKKGKLEKQTKINTFRYPVFEFKEISSFDPPLSVEELTIKEVIETFNSCNFEKAKVILGDLPERSQNRYIRITAIYCGCMLSIWLCNTKKFFYYYGKLETELQDDFPHKEEMSEYIYEINSTLGNDRYYSEDFFNKKSYIFHESFLPRFCNLSSLRLAFSNKQITAEDLTASEIYCKFLEKTNDVFDLQAIHVYLACAYSMLDKTEECSYHFQKALVLAEKYDMFYTIALMQYYYMPKLFDRALENFSEDFKAKIKKLVHDLHERNVRFTNAIQVNSLYKSLTGSDYTYIVFAVQNLTNKEVAYRMHISLGTVGRHYSNLYAQLGVNNKAELVALYHDLTGVNYKQ